MTKNIKGGKEMANTKFLILWQLDTSKMPDGLKEHMTIATRLLNMVKEDSGDMLDWGEFVGGNVGYCIVREDEQKLALDLLKYSPYVRFDVYPVISVGQCLENMEKLSEMCNS